MKGLRAQGFFTGAAILALAGIICRLLGVVIRIPLANIVGNYGMGLYQMVFPLYALLLVVSGAGFPVAISKMVAREQAAGNPKECKRILLNSVILLGIIGAVVTALFMALAYHIAAFQGNRDVGVIYLGIAPSVFLVCIISAFRGYFQGKQNMLPTATSQILEQLVKVAAGITLAVLFIKISVVWAVFGAILAVTISETAALLYLILLYLISLRKHGGNNSPQTPLSGGARGGVTPHRKHLMWQILKTSLPITLMASIFPLILVMDSLLVIKMLQGTGLDNAEATKMFGISSGAVHTLVNLPAVLAAGIAVAIVPAVSGMMKQGKVEEVRKKMGLAIRVTIMISIFFTIFYFAFAEKLIDLLYHGAFRGNPEHLATAGKLLKIESLLIFLMGTSAVFTAMLQGIDKARFPLIALLVGGGAKIAFQFAMIDRLGIYAISIGNVLCFAIASAITCFFALYYIKIKHGVTMNWPRLAALAFGFLVLTLLLADKMPDNRWFVLLFGAICSILYAFLLAILGLLGLNKINIGKNSNKTKGEKHEQTRNH